MEPEAIAALKQELADARAEIGSLKKALDTREADNKAARDRAKALEAEKAALADRVPADDAATLTCVAKVASDGTHTIVSQAVTVGHDDLTLAHEPSVAIVSDRLAFYGGRASAAIQARAEFEISTVSVASA